VKRNKRKATPERKERQPKEWTLTKVEKEKDTHTNGAETRAYRQPLSTEQFTNEPIIKVIKVKNVHLQKPPN